MSKQTLLAFAAAVGIFSAPSALAGPQRASIEPVTLPWQVSLTTEEAFDLFEIIDANHDDYTWQFWTKDYRNYNATYGCHPRNTADDWLVTPPIPMEAGQNYNIIFNVSGNGTYYTEKFEVAAGVLPTAAGMSQGTKLLPVTELHDYHPQEFRVTYSPQTSGNYFIGFHAVSDPDMDRIFLYDVKVETGAVNEAPGEVTGLKVTPDASGDLKATVSFTSPSKSVNGSNISSLSKIEVLRDGTLVKTFDSVTKGIAYSFTDENVPHGVRSYSVIAYSGDMKGKEAKASAFVGMDIPKHPESVTITDNGTNVGVKWSRVTEGVNNLFINPDKITYQVLAFDSDNNPSILMKEVTGATECTIERNTSEGEQSLLQYAVRGVTNGGEGEACYSNAFLVGAPYQLPFNESFSVDGQHGLNNFWYLDGSGLGYSSGFSKVEFDNTSSDYDDSSLKFSAVGYNDIVNLTSGKIKVSGSGNRLFFDYRTDGSTTSEFNLLAVMPDGNELSLGTYNIHEKSGWTQAVVDVPSYMSAMENISFRFQLKAVDPKGPDIPQTLYIDNVNVTDPTAKDLKTQVRLPERVQKGRKGTAEVVVKNVNGADIDSYTLTVKADGKEVYSENVTQQIKAFASRMFKVEIPTSAVNRAETMNVEATVTCPDDVKGDNNTASDVCALFSYDGPTPAGLKLGAENGGLKLDWNAPAIVNTEVEESFEDFTPFQINSFGGWTSFANDEAYTATIFEDFDMPHTYENYGFMVTNFEPEYQVGEYYPGYTGYAFLGCVYGLDDMAERTATDRWLISPPLSGNAQTVSFWARNTPTDFASYIENISVGYSLSGMEMSDFTWTQTATLSGGEWSNVRINVPAGATYFAIRCQRSAEEGFWLLLDDFIFETGPGAVKSYNVYCNGEKVGEPDGLGYLDMQSRNDGDIYDVTALFVNGNESAPASIVYDLSGISLPTVDGDRSADIYDISGRLVRRAAEGLDGLQPGIYIIAGRKVVVK